MMIKKKHSFTVLLVVLLLSACGPEKSRGCPLPPKGFSESDLVGTWDAIGSRGDNTIIIRGDGRYKQIMCVERTEFKRESDWRPWRIEYAEDGLPYLHLEGLLMCAYWDQIDCSTGKTNIEPIEVGDTKDPFADATYWYDGCQKKWVDTPGEGVFMVFGGLKRPPRGIHLVPFTKSSDGTTGPTFELLEPPTNLVFADGFESGDLSAWSAVVTDGDSETSRLLVSPATALMGKYGMQVAVGGSAARYVRDDTPDREPRYSARFYFDPNLAVIPAGNVLDIFVGNDINRGSATAVFRVQLQSSPSGYQVRAQALKNATGYASTPWYPINNARHFIEIDWGNGSLGLFVDGKLEMKLILSGLDTSTYRIDEVTLGKVAGVGDSGTLYFDTFDSGRSATGCASW